jgi:hypothetical protein
VTEMTASGREPGSPPHKPSLHTAVSQDRSGSSCFARPRRGCRRQPSAHLRDAAVMNPVVDRDNFRRPLRHGEENADGPEVLLHSPAVATPIKSGPPDAKSTRSLQVTQANAPAERCIQMAGKEALGPNEPATGCLRLGYASYPERLRQTPKRMAA